MAGFYGRPDEDLAQLAIAVTASNPDAEYPPENLISEDPANPAKLTTGDGWFLLQFAVAILPEWLALIYQYLDPDLTVRIQANSTNSWSSPPYEKAIDIPSKRLDGPLNQRWTSNPWIGLTDNDTPYEWWRLQIVDENSQPVCIGRLMLMSQLRPVDLFHDGDMAETDDPTNIEDRTELGVEHIAVIGGPRRGLSYVWLATDFNAGTDPQEALHFRQLHEAGEGRAHPFLLVPVGAFNDVMCVRPEAGNAPRSHRVGGYQVWHGSVKEVSRGLPFP